MQACIAAGLHPNLIKVQGRVIGHPDDQAALVMDLIDPSYRNLAGLPSLASCTRDIYDLASRFSVAVALRMARGIASVAAHLYRHGITHGDLYGHNILWNAGVIVCWGTLARRHSMPRPTPWKPGGVAAH